jgi:hypothetical protein
LRPSHHQGTAIPSETSASDLSGKSRAAKKNERRMRQISDGKEKGATNAANERPDRKMSGAGRE